MFKYAGWIHFLDCDGDKWDARILHASLFAHHYCLLCYNIVINDTRRSSGRKRIQRDTSPAGISRVSRRHRGVRSTRPGTVTTLDRTLRPPALSRSGSDAREIIAPSVCFFWRACHGQGDCRDACRLRISDISNLGGSRITQATTHVHAS